MYFEHIRTFEGLILCTVGLYLISRIQYDPVCTFNGGFIWYLIFGLIFLCLGLPLCFICSGGCAVITEKRVIIYRTRCFRKRTLAIIPKDDIVRACRISAGRKGIVASFFSMITSFIKGDRKKAADMYDASFLSGYLEVSTEEKSHKIRLSGKTADYALEDISELYEKEVTESEAKDTSYSVIPPAACAAAALIFVIISGITLTAEAKKTVHRQYNEALYLEDTEAYSQAYVEFGHLSERYDYLDSDFHFKYCYARLEISQGNFAEGVERINALPDFEEKKEILYICALSVEQENSAALASEIYTSLGSYKDSADRLALLEESYLTAVKAYEDGDFIKAAEGFSLLRDYKQTSEYVSLLAKEANKNVPPEGNPENLNSKEIIRRCNKALPLLELLSWDSECAAIKNRCDEYIYIYTFD